MSRPVNSRELFAIDRLALAQQALLRGGRAEAGMYPAFLHESLDPDGRPLRPLHGELIEDIEIHRARRFSARDSGG
jgi:hypothetical protein